MRGVVLQVFLSEKSVIHSMLFHSALWSCVLFQGQGQYQTAPIYCASKCSSPLFTIPSICFPSATTVCPVPPLISHQGLYCVPLSHSASKSHTLLYCSAHLTRTCNLYGLFYANKKLQTSMLFTRSRRHSSIQDNVMFVKWSFPARSAFANQIQAAESGHTQMRPLPRVFLTTV